MILRQFLHSDPVSAPYLQAAVALGMRILYVIDTHLHADHVSSGRKLSGKPTSAIGFETRHNTALRIINEAEFVQVMTADIPPPPPEATRNRAINSGQMVPA